MGGGNGILNFHGPCLTYPTLKLVDSYNDIKFLQQGTWVP